MVVLSRSAAPKPASSGDDAPPKLHPERLEATGHVYARSPELIIHDSEQLILPGLAPPVILSGAKNQGLHLILRSAQNDS